MKRSIFVVIIILFLTLSGCLENDGVHIKHEDYPYPSKRKPKDVLIEPYFHEGTNLDLVEEIVLILDVSTIDSKFKNGIIDTYEAFISYGFDLNISEDFFEDKLIVGQIRMYQENIKERKLIKAVDNQKGTIFVYTEYQETNHEKTDANKTHVFLYVLKKETLASNYTSVFFSQIQDHYVDPSSYLYIYFNNKYYEDFNPFYKAILKEFGLNKYFYVEGVNASSIKLRVSDESVSIALVEAVLNDFLSDERILFYQVHNAHDGYYAHLQGHPDVNILRDGWFGFNIDYDYTKTYEENILVVTSKSEYDALIENYINKQDIGRIPNVDVFNGNKDQVIESLQANYDEAFFETSNLVMLALVEGSGSIRHLVSDVIVDDISIKVEMLRMIPYIGTDDMAYYTLYLKVPKGNLNIVINVNNISLYSEDS